MTSITWTWQDSDVPEFQALTESFPGSGYSHLLPLQQSQWDHMVSEMFANDFVDMNTRLVIVELTLFNPSHNLFLVARMATEFTSGGYVIPIAKVDTLKLISYHTDTDRLRFLFEFAAFVMMCVYAVQEIRDMTQPWPRIKVCAGVVLAGNAHRFTFYAARPKTGRGSCRHPPSRLPGDSCAARRTTKVVRWHNRAALGCAPMPLADEVCPRCVTTQTCCT